MEGEETFDFRSEAPEHVRALCEVVFGDDGGHLKNVRLAWEVPLPEAGEEAEREGWRVYKCEVVGHQFAVPHGAPIPTMIADHYDSEGNRESLLYKYVHPDLVEDREALRDRLVRHVRKNIRTHLASLSTSFNLLEALREVEEIPGGVSPHPYSPGCPDERVGYEPAESERPLDSGER